jgi:pimeloyl-ACP methyl ester carboxylesterase
LPQIRANGIAIEVESIGRDSDPAIVLIMGLGAHLTLWPDSLAEGLAAKGYRVIRFDNRDIGKSEHLSDLGMPDLAAMAAERKAGMAPYPPYYLDDMAADTIGVLDALGVAKAHLVGASMGGMIAQIAALRNPKRVKSLVSIMSSSQRPGLPEAKPEAMAAAMTPPKSLSREDRIEASLTAWRAIGGPGPVLDEDNRRFMAGRQVDRAAFDPPALARQSAALIAATPRHEMLRLLKTPTLVIHGADDPLLPLAHGEDVAKSVRGARLVVVPGMGHYIAEAFSPILVKEIGDFVDGVEAG